MAQHTNRLPGRRDDQLVMAKNAARNRITTVKCRGAFEVMVEKMRSVRYL
jgi:hypothetical protein